MKILLCTPQPISQYLGISRVLIELKDHLIELGHEINLIGPSELGIEKDDFTSIEYRREYQNKLKDYLIKNAGNYDIVDYDHEFLPFDRSIFSQSTLFVARTVLLTQHLRHINPPRPRTLRSLLGQIKRSFHINKRLQDADKTIINADLINVPNQKDQEYLIKTGIKAKKICVIPYGVSEKRKKDFIPCSADSPKELKIAFVGSFDYRKGAMDFNHIFNQILKLNPNAKFLLLGCKGLFTQNKNILDFFDPNIHKHIEIIMSFNREEIGKHLKSCSVGIYPSYMEGFPFGIIEMLSCYIPVFSYDAPGAGMMLSNEFLSPPGNKEELARKACSFIKSSSLKKERLNAYNSSLKFSWKNACEETISRYSEHIER